MICHQLFDPVSCTYTYLLAGHAGGEALIIDPVLDGLERRLGPGGDLGELLAHEGRRVVFYCSYGERSALAVKMAGECGFGAAYHIMGGMEAWKGA